MSAILVSLLLLVASAEELQVVRGRVLDERGQPLEGVAVAASFDERLAAARSNESGEFQLAFTPKPNTMYRVTAAKRGYVVAQQEIHSELPPPEPLVFRLAPAPTRVLKIEGPDGKPLAGAKLTSLSFGEPRQYVSVVHPLDILDIVSDAHGNMQLEIAPAGERLSLRLAAEGYGEQLFTRASEPDALQLAPVGSAAGRVTTPDGQGVAGVTVQISTAAPRGPYSNRTATTDADGRFVMSQLVAGKGRAIVRTNPIQPVRPGPQVELIVTAGERTEVVIPVVAAGHVRGRVLVGEPGEPVAGAAVSLRTRDGAESQAKTNADGWYEGFVTAGNFTASLSGLPVPFFAASTREVSAVAAGDAVVELPPLLAVRGVRREGIVVDEREEPVAGAWVTGCWIRREERATMSMVKLAARTDAAGRFVIRGVSPKDVVSFRAETTERAGASYVDVGPESREPIKLRVEPSAAAVVTGRVVDAQSRPLAGVFVRMSRLYRLVDTGEPHLLNERLTWILKTDAEGRFRSPQAVPRDLPFPGVGRGFETYFGCFVSIMHDHRLAFQSHEMIGPTLSPFVLPDIVFKKPSGIEGRVVDRQGRPVPGAEVRSVPASGGQPLLPVTTSADGRFALSEVHPDAPFAFARHADFTFSGAAIPRDGSSLTIVLSRPAEAAADPPLVPLEQPPFRRAAAVQELLLPIWDKLDPAAHGFLRLQIVQQLAEHDPIWALSKVGELRSSRQQIAALSALGKHEEALPLVAGLAAAAERADTLVNLALQLTDRQRGRELLGEAALEYRRGVDPEQRMAGAIHVAEALDKLGDRAAGKKIIDEHLPEIEKQEIWRRGELAVVVARFDLDKGAAIAATISDEQPRSRAFGRIAGQVAAADPAKAEELLKRVAPQQQHSYVEAICPSIAPVDRERALRIALDTPHPAYHDPRPLALGRMALAVFPQDPALARQWLKQAFDLVAPASRSNGRLMFPVAAALVHVSQAVDPAQMREYLWRTIAVAPGTTMDTSLESQAQQKLQADAALAVLLARYRLHPDVAARLAAPLLTSAKVPPARLHGGAAPIAIILTDPAQATKWLDKYLATAAADDLRSSPQPWELMAHAIGDDDARFWRMLETEVLQLTRDAEE